MIKYFTLKWFLKHSQKSFNMQHYTTAVLKSVHLHDLILFISILFGRRRRGKFGKKDFSSDVRLSSIVGPENGLQTRRAVKTSFC